MWEWPSLNEGMNPTALIIPDVAKFTHRNAHKNEAIRKTVDREDKLDESSMI
jgi:hypothetical protein